MGANRAWPVFDDILAILANLWFFNVATTSALRGLEALLAALSLAGGLIPRRRLQEIVAAFYVLLSVIDTFSASASVY